MSVKVKLKYLRIAPRKLRLVADLIRGKTVQQAEDQLRFTVKKGSEPFQKLLKSGVATAENDFGFERSNLYLSEVRVDEGPTLKRTRARARGAFRTINKRTSHLVLRLDQIEKREPKKTRKAGPEAGKEKRDQEKKEKGPTLKRAPKGPEIKERRKQAGRKIFKRKSF